MDKVSSNLSVQTSVNLDCKTVGLQVLLVYSLALCHLSSLAHDRIKYGGDVE